jgi:glycerophosphoryl diester phosphodiesterase
MSHRESIALFKKLDTGMTPELKAGSVTMPFEGFTQQAYAQKLIDEYRMANIPARDVWPQSLDINDVNYWIANEPEFGVQAVALDNIDPTDPSPANDVPPTLAELQAMYER